MTLLTLLGYAVVEPDVPIVGPAGRMNDNYVPDLRNSLWAVLDELDRDLQQFDAQGATGLVSKPLISTMLGHYAAIWNVIATCCARLRPRPRR